jgi:hypothetical protein
MISKFSPFAQKSLCCLVVKVLAPPPWTCGIKLKQMHMIETSIHTHVCVCVYIHIHINIHICAIFKMQMTCDYSNGWHMVTIVQCNKVGFLEK